MMVHLSNTWPDHWFRASEPLPLVGDVDEDDEAAAIVEVQAMCEEMLRKGWRTLRVLSDLPLKAPGSDG